MRKRHFSELAFGVSVIFLSWPLESQPFFWGGLWSLSHFSEVAFGVSARAGLQCIHWPLTPFLFLACPNKSEPGIPFSVRPSGRPANPQHFGFPISPKVDLTPGRVVMPIGVRELWPTISSEWWSKIVIKNAFILVTFFPENISGWILPTSHTLTPEYDG